MNTTPAASMTPTNLTTLYDYDGAGRLSGQHTNTQIGSLGVAIERDLAGKPVEVTWNEAVTYMSPTATPASVGQSSPTPTATVSRTPTPSNTSTPSRTRTPTRTPTSTQIPYTSFQINFQPATATAVASPLTAILTPVSENSVATPATVPAATPVGLKPDCENPFEVFSLPLIDLGFVVGFSIYGGLGYGTGAGVEIVFDLYVFEIDTFFMVVVALLSVDSISGYTGGVTGWSSFENEEGVDNYTGLSGSFGFGIGGISVQVVQL